MASPPPPPLGSLQWDNRQLRDLPADPDRSPFQRQVFGAAYSLVAPTPVPAPKLLAWSPDVAQDLGLSPEDVASDTFLQAMAGNQILPGSEPSAACYGGHQFGNWAGQLGDGRAISLGEVRGPDDRHWELQLKGSGPTPYSRSGDGRAVLRSSIREYLCSEAMHHLGVPTTRALCLIGTGEGVPRDMMYSGNIRDEPGAIVCRVAPTFLRFGSFQIHYARNDVKTLSALVRHTMAVHYSHIEDTGVDGIIAWLRELAERTAEMVVAWERVGFVHGVMNTDNMSVLGLTIDYGPYGWLDNFDPDWTPNTTDAGQRRYRFGHQIHVGMWNLVRLVEALHPLVNDVPSLQGVIDHYDKTVTRLRGEMMRAKLGLDPSGDRVDEGAFGALLEDLEIVMRTVETDMTLFYRRLATIPTSMATAGDGAALAQHLAEAYYPKPGSNRSSGVDQLDADTLGALGAWFRAYGALLRADGQDDAVRFAAMNKVNPLYVLRNYLAQEAIDLAEEGDLSRVHLLQDLLRSPYTEQADRAHFAERRPDWARTRAGCSMLSCSS
jgi:serine/tyrosine/threonine adenylyltransferase